jgi:hypothetical protein
MKYWQEAPREGVNPSLPYYYYYIQVLRPYASLWAYDRRVSDETVYKSLKLYTQKRAEEAY